MMRREVEVYREVALMRVRFPSFRCQLTKGMPTWYGTLQPTEASPCYYVRLMYRWGSPPKVWVVTPALHPNAPHRYPDKSLCLYYPKEESWTPSAGIANTIVPWTAEWLFCYELWLTTGKWWGPEAPHALAK
jgi:hypothetical protein